MTEVIEMIGRIAWGLLIAGCGLALAPYLIWRTYKSAMRRRGKVAAIMTLLVVGTLCADSGIGLVTQGDESARTVITENENSSRLFLLFPGYNGSGQSLTELLSPYLQPHGTVIAFESSHEGYDNDQVLRLALQEIDTRQPSEIVVYGESFGGMVVADLLRLRPSLTLRGAVLNASPAKASHLLTYGSLLWATRLLHGGPLSTLAFRIFQASQIGTLPQAGSAEETAADRANRRSLEITAPTALDQLSYIAEFTAPSEGEFGNRVLEVCFIHAPGDKDALIANKLASDDWRKAFEHGRYTDVTMPWNEGEHVPTPAHPGDVAAQLLAVAGIG